MIAASIGTIVLAGVMSAFLMLTRSGVSAANYSEMEAQVRRALEQFSLDVRMASAITWTSNRSITLTVPDNYTDTNNQVTYYYDSATIGPTAQSFCLKTVNPDTGAVVTQRRLVRNVSTFFFSGFNRLNVATTSNIEIKRVQITMTVSTRTTGITTAATTDSIMSASYILRNKPTS